MAISTLADFKDLLSFSIDQWSSCSGGFSINALDPETIQQLPATPNIKVSRFPILPGQYKYVCHDVNDFTSPLAIKPLLYGQFYSQ